MIEFVDDALGDLRKVDVDIGLHGDIDLRTRRSKPESRDRLSSVCRIELSPDNATWSEPCCSACVTIWSIRARRSK